MPVHNHTGQAVAGLRRAESVHQDVLGLKLWFEF